MVLAILIGTNACSSKKETPVPKTKKPSGKISPNELTGIKQEVYSFKVEGFGEGSKVQWHLEGESANVVHEKINIKNLKAVYHEGDTVFTIFADRAVYDKKTQDIELEDNIIGKTSDGGELITDYAKWHAKTEEITTESYVIVKRENMECIGKGLITKPRLKWVAFRKEVEVDIKPDRKIICDGPFEIDHEKSVAIFNKNVKISDKESDTFADRLTVYLDPVTNEIIEAVTEGNVKVVHRGDMRDMDSFSFN